MRLIVVRHGETEENVAMICQGQLHGNLTSNGKLQAGRIGKKLKKEKLDLIFSSDLKRAKDTAKEISKHHKNVPVVYTKDLRELKKGIFQGKSASVFDRALEKSGKKIWQFAPDGVESWSVAYKRAKKFYSFLLKNYSDKTILLVSHGTFIGIIISAILNVHVRNALSFEEHQTHECVNVIQVDKKGRGTIKTINCERHIKKLVC